MAMKFAATAALLCGLWPAQAMADDTDDDLKCLVASMAMVQSGDPDDQSVGMLSTMYWLGRLDGRTPALDLENKAKVAAEALKPADLAAETARCGDLLAKRGAVLTNMGSGTMRPNIVPD